jgi:4'-phosphopantetheinyl transferase
MTASPPSFQGLSESITTGCEVLLVRLSLTATDSECRQLAALLAAEEQERAGRRLPDVRRRAVVSRGRLRQLLGRLLALPPQAVPLATNPHGKPILSGRHADSIAFNVSHSGDEGLIAVTRRGPVGIDLEISKPTQDAAWARLMAGTIFAAAELAHWQTLPEHQAAAAVLDAWVAKEAVFKAAGTGIGDRLRQCLLPRELPRPGLPQDGSPGWYGLVPVELPSAGSASQQQFGLTLLELGARCHAALACQAASATVRLRSFEAVLREGLD